MYAKMQHTLTVQHIHTHTLEFHHFSLLYVLYTFIRTFADIMHFLTPRLIFILKESISGVHKK